ncbi:NAD(P)/FAD-dependent oxidoreductase [Mesorhizobium sp. BAC0120]|uniref:flavin-containing monooxygenase n=1 Tax=Mesorhizobium sp. BAC0120 TaxID=3090670 RepID=UPI00298C7A84|nr:NAD(P)/FAD-dependent oxidoreductase [Mesorhizobium sp. BAC0120]MDW6024851.1 NAD(P)/FAD-dependent oxidoreductase [Mesorhizobium sp. BAC0120]
MPEQARERVFSPALELSGALASGFAGTGPDLAVAEPEADQTDFDVIVVGAGLSGIGVGYHLQRDCPRKSFAILEARGAIGGTWDLFRYPGIRSDSDMYTLGYRFRPWHGESSFADGASILEYLRDTAREYGIDRKIRYRHKVMRASWSSSEARWQLEVSGPDGKALAFTCSFLQLCSGYYDYDAGYMPGWPGMDRFAGEIVHPQKWPDGLDYAGKRVVVIGSGATAVTMVPALTDKAAHVTMLQRSPTYIVARPAKDSVASWLYSRLPERLAYALARWKNIFLQMYFYNAARRKPEAAKEYIIELAEEELGPGFDVEKHFTPRYNPWDQRLCLVPDGDLFKAIREGKASVVTDEIETFSETGLKLRSGEELPADIIVCATGLVMRLMGGIELLVDGRNVNPGATMIYRGVMLSDVPNLALTFGYANASWTLKADLVAEYLCRILNKMDRDGYAFCTPRNDPSIIPEATLPLSSGYMQRAKDMLPKQGSRRPWKLYQNYAKDVLSLRFGSIDDGVLTFTRRAG